jgi:LysM repeat protein
MKTVSNLLQSLKQHRYTVLAVVLIFVIVLGYLLFYRASIAPALQAQSDARGALVSAQQALVDASRVQNTTPDQMQMQVLLAQTSLVEPLKGFLSDLQAGQILNVLYQYASASGVLITDLQTQPITNTDTKELFTITTARLHAQGDAHQLLDFVARIKDVTSQGFLINAVNLTTTQAIGNLTLNVTLYTSPFASGDSVIQLSPAPVPAAGSAPPTAAPPAVNSIDQLTLRLDHEWAAKNWPEVIGLLEQIHAVDPNFTDLMNKLYSAHVNNGYLLIAANRLDDARIEFEQALAIKPDGDEATVALRQLTAPPSAPASPPTPVPAATVYVVRFGDTLFSIARRYGVSVPALMAANGLTTNNIPVGLQLVIPAP